MTHPARPSIPTLLALATFLACGPTDADRPAEGAGGAAPTEAVAEDAPDEGTDGGHGAEAGPPLGRYVCRQGTTTMGYVTLKPGGVYVLTEDGPEGRYAYDPATGEVVWHSGKHAEWKYAAIYDHRTAESLGRPQDEHIIRMTDETGRLKIDCFLMGD